jgi:hypothetical protein
MFLPSGDKKGEVLKFRIRTRVSRYDMKHYMSRLMHKLSGGKRITTYLKSISF